MRAETERRVEESYAKLLSCTDHELRIAITAEVILCVFDEFYCQLCEYPYRAQRAFETMDPQASNRISTERLGLYSRFITEHGPRILAAFPALADRFDVWDSLDRLFAAMIVDRYEADIAFSFAHSLRRNICHEMWRPVAYSFPPPSKLRALSMAQAHRRFPVHGRIGVELICEALRVPGFSVRFEDLRRDAERILDRLRDTLHIDAAGGSVPLALDVVDAGFYRDRSAFLVGRWVFAGDRLLPFVVAFLNGEDGIRADAVLHQVSDIHDLFSSTLANLHVTTRCTTKHACFSTASCRCVP
jgi:isocitrate dehydrogenase kinase/phosphatase